MKRYTHTYIYIYLYIYTFVSSCITTVCESGMGKINRVLFKGFAESCGLGAFPYFLPTLGYCKQDRAMRDSPQDLRSLLV